MTLPEITIYVAIAATLVIMVVIIGLVIRSDWKTLEIRKSGQRVLRSGRDHGFEVKQTTGTEPVMQKKDNDHG